MGVWARGRLPSGARDLVDTEDLVQETLVRTIGNWPFRSFAGVGALQAYLRQSVANRVRDERVEGPAT